MLEPTEVNLLPSPSTLAVDGPRPSPAPAWLDTGVLGAGVLSGAAAGDDGVGDGVAATGTASLGGAVDPGVGCPASVLGLPPETCGSW